MFAELSEHLLEGIFSFVLIKQNIKSSLQGIIFSWRLFIATHQRPSTNFTHRNGVHELDISVQSISN